MKKQIIPENWELIEKAEQKAKNEKGDPDAGFNPTLFHFDGLKRLMLSVKYRTKKGKKGAEVFTKSYKDIYIEALYCPFSGKPLYKDVES